jgi:hypothetical protein
MALKTISIVRAGSLTSRSPKGPNTTTPFVIEVETSDGAAYLQMRPQASAVVAEELATYSHILLTRQCSKSIGYAATLQSRVMSRPKSLFVV